MPVAMIVAVIVVVVVVVVVVMAVVVGVRCDHGGRRGGGSWQKARRS